MVRRRPVDFINWRLYRRAFVVPVLALLVLLATSVEITAPTQATLPPTLATEQAAELLDEATEYAKLFPDRRPGSPGDIDSAQWMRDEFEQLPGSLRTKTVPATTIDPGTGRSVGLVNVEAVLAGRTRELVVVYAHRDTADASGRGSDAVGQLSLLALARELSGTRDRRRTYLFVSTDGATLNGGGARALAERLAGRGAVVAVIGIDRLGAGGTLRVDTAPSGRFAAPLGLVTAATEAVAAEGGSASTGSVLAQTGRLAAPLTLREHGQVLAQGLPALTITAGDDQLRGTGDRGAEDAAVGAGLRSVQRLLGTLDQMDQLQSVGKTWVSTDRCVYRGWALKIFIAALLVPVWVAAVDMLVRHRRGWNLAAALGTSVRAMLAGMASVVALWVLGVVGALPATGDRPPNPGSVMSLPVLAIGCWLLLTAGAWLLARGPDWRRQRRARARVAAGPDTAELVVALVVLVVVGVATLGVNPYTVLFAVPALHAWMCMASWRVVFDRRRALVVWAAGFVGPLLALVAIATRSDTGLGAPLYVLQLVQSRTIPPTLALALGAGAGLVVLLVVATLGQVSNPALPRIRARVASYRDGEIGVLDLVPGPIRRGLTGARGQLVKLRVPQGPGRGRETAAGRAGDRSTAARMRERARREDARSTDRRRSLSR